MASAVPRLEALARLKEIARALGRARQLEQVMDIKLRPLRYQVVSQTVRDASCLGHISTELLAVLTEDLHSDIESDYEAATGQIWGVLELWKQELRRRIFDEPLDSPVPSETEAYEPLRQEYLAEREKLERLLASRVRLLTERSELTANLDHTSTPDNTEEVFPLGSGSGSEINLFAASQDDFQLLSQEGSFPMLRPHYFWPELSPTLWQCFRTALERTQDRPQLSPTSMTLPTLPKGLSDLSIGHAGVRASSASMHSALAGASSEAAAAASGAPQQKLPPRSYSVEASSSGRKRVTLTIQMPATIEDVEASSDNALPELLQTLTGPELEASLREHIFYGGVAHELRPEVWKYLCNFYPNWFLRPDERRAVDNARRSAYELLLQRTRQLCDGVPTDVDHPNLTPNNFSATRKKIEKDAVRTDQDSLFFKGPDNPNTQRLRETLLCYAIYNPGLGYVQGMSDVMAPFLATMDNDADAFWCFVGFMDSTLKENFELDHYAMRRQMATIRSLLQIVDPQLLSHCERLESGDLVFTFRWLVVFFKREFAFTDVLRLWEILWSNHLSVQFHLFVALAMLHLVRADILTKASSSHELLSIINKLSETLDLDEVRYRAELLFSRVMAIWSSPDAMDAVLANSADTPNIIQQY